MPRAGICVAGILASVVHAATLQVEIRDSEVWLLRDGEPLQLTRDGMPKVQALLSSTAGRVAYYETCPGATRCLPKVVILDLTGQRVSSFLPPECANLYLTAWASDRTLASQCHLNPSLDEYFESDVASGRTIRDLLGYGFTRSPDGTRVAHAGWIVHFAPPYAHSNYLQLDNTVVYPLPPGIKPVIVKNGESPPGVVRQQGVTYSGIHEFPSEFFWAPDSRHIAFIDCIYTWTANSIDSQNAADGKESDRQCSVVAVSPSGSFIKLSLTVAPNLAKLSWASANELAIRVNSVTRPLRLR